MAEYDLHFVDHGRNVYDALQLERDTDAAAIEEAHRLNVPSMGNGFDIWQDGRLVHRHRPAGGIAMHGSSTTRIVSMRLTGSTPLTTRPQCGSPRVRATPTQTFALASTCGTWRLTS
jgi:hypothetical protein